MIMLELLQFGKAISFAPNRKNTVIHAKLDAEHPALLRHFSPLIEQLLREQNQFFCSPEFEDHQKLLTNGFQLEYNPVNDGMQRLGAFLEPHFAEINLIFDFYLLIELISLQVQDQLVNASLLVFPGDRILHADADPSSDEVIVKTALSLSKPSFAMLFTNGSDDELPILHFASKSLLPYQIQYLKDKIIGARPYENSFHLTADAMQMSNAFIREFLPPDQVDKTERSDLLQRTLGYFKENERFDETDFCNQILEDTVTPDLFRQFRVSLGHEDTEPMQFDISKEAVQKQGRIFKSVLKLDKNFHVYIHGDKRLIERGQDDNGRKFYKLYYDKEF
jgi:hypothetical protein